MTWIAGLARARPRAWLVWLSAAVVCCAAVAMLLAHRDEARRLWEGLTQLPRSTIIAALLLIVAQVMCQALRFWAIIPRSARVSVSLATQAFTLGECANIVALGRAGDVMKAVLMNRPGNGADVNLSRAAGAVLADKVIDIGSVVLLCVATGALGVLAAGARAALPGPMVVLGITVLLPIGVTATWFARPVWFTRLRSTAGEVVLGLSALKAPGPVLASASFSLGAWVAELLALQLLCGGLGFSPAMLQLMVAVIILNASVLVPIAVANVGVYEAALAFGLTQAGIPLTAAVAIAIAHHALELLALGLTTLGLLLVARVSRPNLILRVPL